MNDEFAHALLVTVPIAVIIVVASGLLLWRFWKSLEADSDTTKPSQKPVAAMIVALIVIALCCLFLVLVSFRA